MENYHLWKPSVNLLQQCRPAFKTTPSYCWAFLAVIAFCLQGGEAGVTGLSRAVGLSPHCYTSFLAFFHGSSVNLPLLQDLWLKSIQTAFKEHLFKIDGHPIIAVDEIKIGKEGKYMPGSRSTFQSSQNNSKRPFIMGHTLVVFTLIITSATKYARAIPFFGRILSGLRTGARHLNTQIDDTVESLVKISASLATTPIVVADALYAIQTFIKPLVAKGIHVISRMRNNSVAAYPAEVSETPKRGRPKKYGAWIKLIDLFENTALFTKIKSPIPDEDVEILYYSIELLTRWFGDLLLFILVKHPSRGNIILVSSNRELSPMNIYLAYYHRFQIEITFKQLKHQIYAFSYKFWTKAMTKIRRGDKDHHIHKKTAEEKNLILSTFSAYHIYIQLSFMAFGILQYISLTNVVAVYRAFGGWLRTIRPNLMPSVGVVSEALSNQVEAFFNSNNLPPEITKFLNQKRSYTIDEDEDSLKKAA